MRNKIITERHTYIEINYRFTVIDFRCLGISYGLLLPTSEFVGNRNGPGQSGREFLTQKLGPSTLSLRAVGQATVLPHKCDILSLLKEDQIARDNRLPVHCRHLTSRRHRAATPVATQMSLPPVC